MSRYRSSKHKQKEQCETRTHIPEDFRPRCFPIKLTVLHYSKCNFREQKERGFNNPLSEISYYLFVHVNITYTNTPHAIPTSNGILSPPSID